MYPQTAHCPHSSLCSHGVLQTKLKATEKQGTAYSIALRKHHPQTASCAQSGSEQQAPATARAFPPRKGRSRCRQQIVTDTRPRAHTRRSPAARSRFPRRTHHPIRGSVPFRPGAHLAAPGKPMAYSVTTTAPPRPRLCCRARRAPPTCRFPARPRSCQQSSAHCARPETSSTERVWAGRRGGGKEGGGAGREAHTRLGSRLW